jgi:hypothetical protein
MFEVRRSAVSVADALRADDLAMAAQDEPALLFEQPPLTPGQLEVVAPLAEPVPPAIVEPVLAAPALHVVDTGYEALTAFEPAHALDEPLDPTHLEPVQPYSAPYEPVEPYAAPYAAELAPPVSPWGISLSAVTPPEAVRRDTTGWTGYDQTGYEPSGHEPTGHEATGPEPTGEPGNWS